MFARTGRVVSNVDNLNGTSATSSYSYDLSGRLTQATIDNINCKVRPCNRASWPCVEAL